MRYLIVQTNRRGIMKPGIGSHSAIGTAIWLLIIACVLVSGCNGGSETIWSAEALSPDATRLASARTIANSGFGTGYIWTAVYLNRVKGSQPPTEILELSDEFETPSDEISVGMRWLTRSHLELTYKGHRTLNFRAVKCAGVDIFVRDLSSVTTNTSK
jgi:hypothetical protein